MPQSKSRSGIHFTPTQNRIITTTITFFSTLVLLMGIFFVGNLILQTLSYLVHIVGPVIVAFFLSMLTRPWYQRLNVWCNGRKPLALILFSLSFLVPITIFCYFFGAFVVDQVQEISARLPNAFHAILEFLRPYFPKGLENLHQLFPLLADGSYTVNLQVLLGKGIYVGDTLFAMGSAALLWLLTFFYWIIFIMFEPMKTERLIQLLPFLGEHHQAAATRYCRNFMEIMESYFRGQMIDVAIQGLLYGVAFSLVGLPNGFVIGVILGFLNLMPYLGVMVGLCVALPMAFLAGGIHLMVAVVLVFCCIQTFDGYIMQPYIQGQRMRLSAWQIVFALLLWTKIGGFLGLLLAIPLTAFFKASWGELRAFSQRFVEDSANDTL